MAQGFNIIELMMTLTILGILLVIAIPAFRDFILDQRVKNASFELNITLQFARSEAVKRMQQVSVTPEAGGWADGYTVTYPDDDDADTDDEVLKTVGAQDGINITSAATIVTFRKDGRASAGGGSTFVLGVTPSRPGVSSRCIRLEASGLPTNIIATSC
jgi:type IV fimbrial biogenesis protein FimT